MSLEMMLSLLGGNVLVSHANILFYIETRRRDSPFAECFFSVSFSYTVSYRERLERRGSTGLGMYCRTHYMYVVHTGM